MAYNIHIAFFISFKTNNLKTFKRQPQIKNTLRNQENDVNMKVVIIGNGVAGQNVAEGLRQKDSTLEIVILTEESHPYYSRIFLPEYITMEKKLDQLYTRKLDWYPTKNITLKIGTKVTKINPDTKQIFIETQNEPIKYDKLVLATGSSARKLPYNKPNIGGMFTLRNIADADFISQYIDQHAARNVFIIGGGLLGIELGFHLLQRKLNVTICEIFPYLLPRQLDQDSARILEKYLEFKGIHILTGKEVVGIDGDSNVQGVILKSGEKLPCDVIFQQMGVIPNIGLAKDAGLKTDKGILVNEFMQTSNPDIYAAGDCIQFKTQLWGIIPASLEQAKLVVGHILNQSIKPYEGTFWNTRLKIAGLKLACYGTPPQKNAPDETVLANTDEDCYLCRKVILKDNIIKGAIVMGSGDDLYFQKNLGKSVKSEELQAKINEKTEDKSVD